MKLIIILFSASLCGCIYTGPSVGVSLGYQGASVGVTLYGQNPVTADQPGLNAGPIQITVPNPTPAPTQQSK